MGSDTDKSSDPRRKDDPAASPAPVAPDQTLDLAAILDLPAVTALLHSFWELTGMLAAIVDRHGRVLVQVGWQQICTDFHRCHPTSRENCRASDTILAQIPSAGSYQTYRCKNGLWDSSAPIMVAGQHLGNIYFGQFIFSDEEADRDFFRHQARRYGFDEVAYLAALDRVPRYDRDTVDRLMAFYARLGEMIADLSYSKLSLTQTLVKRQQAEAELKESEKKFQMLFTKAPLGYQSLDGQGRFIDVNPKWLEILGYSKAEVIGRWFGDFLCPEYVEGFRQRFPLFIQQGYIHSEFEMRCRDGQRRMIAFDGKIGYDVDGSFKQTHCILQDITDRKAIEEELNNEKELFKTTLISIGDGVIATDTAGRVLIMNRVAEQLTGWSQAEARCRPIEDVFQIVNEFTRLTCANPVAQVLADKRIITMANHTLLVDRNGRDRPIEDSAAPIMTENGELTGVVLVFRDFTDKKKNQAAIEYLSFHDHLTGLYNRRFYEEELARLDTARNWPLTIVMGDVNGLKLINDSFGHASGDLLLQKTAAALTRGSRADDIIARIGGDEFVMLLPQTSAREAGQLIKRIKRILATQTVAGLEISVAFGSATKNRADADIAAVFRQAEDMMYHHKLYEGPSLKGRVIDNIVAVLNQKSPREEAHARQVADYCQQLGSALGLEDDQIRELKALGLLHDIGKIAIGDAVLNKVGPFSVAERQEMETHAEIGYRILSTNHDMVEIADYVLAHHEHWDGKGYPKGLSGPQIPLPARICAIADAYDAMTSPSHYQPTRSAAAARAELKRCAGSQFDPELVALFVGL